MNMNLLWKEGFVKSILTLFWLGGYQIDTCLPFSLYLRHGFHSESEQPYQNRVNPKYVSWPEVIYSELPHLHLKN